MPRIKVGFCRLLPIVPVALFAGFSAFAEDAASAPEVVWVKADRAAFETQGVIGDGSETNPFNTIQKGIDTVAVGGTVKIMAGIYDYDEHFDGTHTNRIVISKRVILDGVGGKDATHIVGKLSAGNVGNGSDAIRCIKIGDNNAKNTIIRNVTLRNGGASTESSTEGYGGAVCGVGSTLKNHAWLVDCVVSNCAAAWGGGLNSASAMRCVISDCRATAWGTAVRYGNLMHCFITKAKNYGSNGNRPAVEYSYVVNCTLVKTLGITHGFGRGCNVYNCIAYDCGASEIVHGDAKYNVNEFQNCYGYIMTGEDAHTNPFLDYQNGDYRLKEGTPARDGALTQYFEKIVLPERVLANIDLAGNEFDITKSTCDIGCYQRILDWYVDAENGDDDNSGSVATSPMKTLAAIMPKTLPGDTVHAAAGTYNEGIMRKSATTAKARVVVPKNVTLVADEGAKSTFIVGAPDTTESADEYGFGTNAVRCVHLEENSKIKGFTITGGYTWSGTLEGFSNNNRSGGGICGDSPHTVLAEECIISNNWASYSGGGVFYAAAVRSYLFENHSTYQGGAMHDGKLYGCVVDKNYTGFSTTTRPSSCWAHRAIVNCTLGPDIFTHDNGNKGCVVTAEGSGAIFSYNIVMGTMGAYSDGNYKLVGCVFQGAVGSWDKKLQNCIVNAGDGLQLDENYRPLPGSVGVDMVTVDELNEATGGKLPTNKDLSGFQRMMNGKIDVGALEADWRGEYAKLLDGFGNRINVTSATSDVTTNDVNSVSSVALVDGESISLEWWNAEPFARRSGKAYVTGEGMLTILRNGVEFATYKASSSPVEFSIPTGNEELFDFTFSFSGEGSANIYNFAAAKGTLFTIH